jgi:hypothetical protein
MLRDYDIFETFPDGATLWRGNVKGLESVGTLLRQLAKQTTNECFAMHIPSNEVVARINVPGSGSRKPLVLQIAYEADLGTSRANLLRLNGYEVVTVCGNEAAKVVLTKLPPDWNLFIVGHAAPASVRETIVGWLKDNYPKVYVLALNGPEVSELTGSDFNAKLNDSEKWLAIITSVLGGDAPSPRLHS